MVHGMSGKKNAAKGKGFEKMIPVRASPDDIKKWKAHAAEKGCPLVDWVNQSLNEKMKMERDSK